MDSNTIILGILAVLCILAMFANHIGEPALPSGPAANESANVTNSTAPEACGPVADGCVMMQDCTQICGGHEGIEGRR